MNLLKGLIKKISIPNLAGFQISYMEIEMNMDLLQTRFMAPAGTVGGAVVGGLIAGPAGIVTGAKLGACVGAQIGLAGKVDKAADSTLEIGVRTLEKVVDKWSAIFLIGYAGSYMLSGVSSSMDNYSKFCYGPLQNINCAAMSLTVLSFNTVAVAAAAAIGHEIYKLTCRK